MGATESAQKEQVEKEKVEEYERFCRYELMRQDLMQLASREDSLFSHFRTTVMGTEEVHLPANKGYPVGPDGKRLKPCCACPETKRARDACIVEKGEEHCTELIEAHKACMRSLGFNI